LKLNHNVTDRQTDTIRRLAEVTCGKNKPRRSDGH